MADPGATGYDAVVVGAGPNGLCLAAYLQRAGLATVVFDSRPVVGGMARTEEPALPGFRHNPHANYFSYQDVMPMVADFGLRSHGLMTTMPVAQHGMAFSDGRPPVVLHRPDSLDRTHANLARHARADADTFVALERRALRLGPTVAAGLYRPPTGDWFGRQAVAVHAAFDDMGITAGLGTRSGTALVDELFESDGVRALLYQALGEFGVRADQPGGDFSFLAFVLWIVGQARLPIGGMQTVVEAMARACRAEGVRLVTGSAVRRIVVEHGRAVGVVVGDDDVVRARQLVASTADIRETLRELVGTRWLDASTQRDLASLGVPASTLASQMFCLRRPPAYLSARHDADIDRCFRTVVGIDSADESLAHLRDIDAGLLARPVAGTRVNSLWDGSQAPPGLHVAGADSAFPAVDLLAPDDWEVVRSTYSDALLRRWADFAPNMTRDNVLADHFEPPGRFDRTLLLKEGTAQYRTGVDRLYLCGAATFPGGGVHGACGYNAYQAIAEDLDLASPVHG